MAIITTVATPSSIFPDQYVRVESVTTNKTKMKITIGAYFSAEAVSTLPPHFSQELEGNFDMYSSDNLWQQAYSILKNHYTIYTDII